MRNIRIFTDLDRLVHSEIQGNLKLKKHINTPCSNYRADCMGALDCLNCKNCMYDLKTGDKFYIKFDGYEDIEGREEKYLIDFFDDFDFDFIMKYLMDENSDYRMSNIGDSCVVRLSKKDLDEYEKKQEVEDVISVSKCFTIGEEFVTPEEKPKIFKKFFKRFF